MDLPPHAPPPAGGFGYGAPPPGTAGPTGLGPMAFGPYGLDPLTGLPVSDKSRIVAGLLSIFLGGFGVGRFYLGHVGLGIAQLSITVLSCGMLGWIWPIIDAIFIFTGKVTDAQGRPLRE
jgi:TM2 domain-containing membrane protein YozV